MSLRNTVTLRPSKLLSSPTFSKKKVLPIRPIPIRAEAFPVLWQTAGVYDSYLDVTVPLEQAVNLNQIAGIKCADLKPAENKDLSKIMHHNDTVLDVSKNTTSKKLEKLKKKKPLKNIPANVSKPVIKKLKKMSKIKVKRNKKSKCVLRTCLEDYVEQFHISSPEVVKSRTEVPTVKCDTPAKSGQDSASGSEVEQAEDKDNTHPCNSVKASKIFLKRHSTSKIDSPVPSKCATKYRTIKPKITIDNLIDKLQNSTILCPEVPKKMNSTVDVCVQPSSNTSQQQGPVSSVTKCKLDLMSTSQFKSSAKQPHDHLNPLSLWYPGTFDVITPTFPHQGTQNIGTHQPLLLDTSPRVLSSQWLAVPSHTLSGEYPGTMFAEQVPHSTTLNINPYATFNTIPNQGSDSNSDTPSLDYPGTLSVPTMMGNLNYVPNFGSTSTERRYQNPAWMVPLFKYSNGGGQSLETQDLRQPSSGPLATPGVQGSPLSRQNVSVPHYKQPSVGHQATPAIGQWQAGDGREEGGCKPSKPETKSSRTAGAPNPPRQQSQLVPGQQKMQDPSLLDHKESSTVNHCLTLSKPQEETNVKKQCLELVISDHVKFSRYKQKRDEKFVQSENKPDKKKRPELESKQVINVSPSLSQSSVFNENSQNSSTNQDTENQTYGNETENVACKIPQIIISQSKSVLNENITSLNVNQNLQSSPALNNSTLASLLATQLSPLQVEQTQISTSSTSQPTQSLVIPPFLTYNPVLVHAPMYKCSDCDLTSSDYVTMHDHTKIPHVYQCFKMCPMRFINLELLQNHVTLYHQLFLSFTNNSNETKLKYPNFVN